MELRACFAPPVGLRAIIFFNPPHQACVPFNLVITGDNATVTPTLDITAELSVLDAVRANVSANGTLSLGASSFSTSAPITAVLRVPAASVTRVAVASPGGTTVLATGLAPTAGALTLSAFGASELQARSLTLTTLNASANGASTLVAEGVIGGADVAAIGGARVYVAGVSDAVDVRARGAARVFLAPTASNVSITGTLRGGGASITTTKGACDLVWAGGGGGGGSPPTAPRCSRATVTLPSTSSTLWTCGVALVGGAGASCAGGFGALVVGDDTAFPWSDAGGAWGDSPGAMGAAPWDTVSSMMNAMVGGGGGPAAGPGMVGGGGGGPGAFASAFGRRLAGTQGAVSFASSSGGGGGQSSYMSSTTDSNGKTIVSGGGKGGGSGGAVITGRDGTTVYTSNGDTGGAFVSSDSRGATVINSGGRVTYLSDDGAAPGEPAPTVVTAPRCAVADKDRKMGV